MDLQPPQLLERCPICQAMYAPGEIRLLHEREKSRLYHCTCRACGHAMMAVIFEGAGWLSSVGVMTDLEAKDAARLATVPPISSDECIEIHGAIEQQSANVCQILLKESQASSRSV